MSPTAPQTAPDPDIAARRALRRHRALAGGLLLLMAALTLAAHAAPPNFWVLLLRAAATAGLVGGLADWFAVTALFRHPLGLPIPHTAIIPAQKERLGAALGRFVANHVFTAADVSRVLERLDMPGLAARLLADPATARPAAATVAEALPRIMSSIEDGRARRFVSRLIPRLASGPAAGRLVAGALRGLVAGGRHQEVLNFILVELRRTLGAKEDQLRVAIEERVREQGGRLVGWALGATIARRVLASLNAELDKIGPDSVELRAAFDEWTARELDRLETDPARAAELGQAIRQMMAHESVQGWLWDVWARLRMALEADAARPNSHTITLITGALGNLGQIIDQDPEARARLQAAGERAFAAALPAARTQLADFIASVIGGWDTATLTERLELRVGKDLQYVRINGTLVGFLAGGVLDLLLRALFG